MDRQGPKERGWDTLTLQPFGTRRELAGQLAIVTGAGGGIGQAIAVALAAAGADVVIHYYTSPAAAQQVAQLCTAYGVRALTVAADLTDPAQVRGLVVASTALGQPQILVNNAAISLTTLLQETTLEAWEQVFRINLTAPFLCTQAVLPYMLRCGTGRIVNISSVWGMVGGSHEVAYSASKSGLIGFTKALAKELGPSGVTVNAVAPGAVETSMLDGLTAEEQNNLSAAIPVGRFGQPQEVASAVVYLASPASAYMTGQVLSPNGGWVT